MTRFVFLSITLTAIVSGSVLIDFRSGGVGPAPDAAMEIGPPAAISAPGIVEGASEEIPIRPETRGLVVRRPVEVGDRVTRGQLLLQLDDREARARVAAARAELASAGAQRDRLINGARSHERREARALRDAAEARLRQAEQALARTEQLETRRAVSEQEADDARSTVDALQAEHAAALARSALLDAPARSDELRLADARVEAARSKLRTAELLLEKTRVHAPGPAQVLDIDAEVGELVSPTSRTPVLVLSDTRRLRVRAFVEELDAPRVPLNAEATISIDGLPGREFTGKVARLSPRMDAKSLGTGRPGELYDTKTREVLIDVDSGAGLIVGIRADVRILCRSEP